MQWLKYSDTSNSLLMILHSPGNLILWNAETGLKIWRKNFSDPLISFALDPFNEQTLTGNIEFWCNASIDFVQFYYILAEIPSIARVLNGLSVDAVYPILLLYPLETPVPSLSLKY